MFKPVIDNIYKLDIPFDNITTGSFLVKTSEGDILVDCGTTEADVLNLLLPSLEKAGAKIKYLFLTHFHNDHAGGAPFVLKAFPETALICFNGDLCKRHKNSVLLKNKDEIISDIVFLSLPGHSFDSGALLDKRTNSMITGDSLQLWGITKHGCGVGQPKEYQKSLLRLRANPPQNIFAAHEYYPLGSTALGKDKVLCYIDECEAIYSELCRFALEKRQYDPAEIAADFIDMKRAAHPHMPIIQPHVISAIIKTLAI